MTMYNPPHPGEFILEVYLEPNGISGRELAESLGVAASTLSRVLKGLSRVSPEMALEYEKFREQIKVEQQENSLLELERDLQLFSRKNKS